MSCWGATLERIPDSSVLFSLIFGRLQAQKAGTVLSQSRTDSYYYITNVPAEAEDRSICNASQRSTANDSTKSNSDDFNLSKSSSLSQHLSVSKNTS